MEPHATANKRFSPFANRKTQSCNAIRMSGGLVYYSAAPLLTYILSIVATNWCCLINLTLVITVTIIDILMATLSLFFVNIAIAILPSTGNYKKPQLPLPSKSAN